MMQWQESLASDVDQQAEGEQDDFLGWTRGKEQSTPGLALFPVRQGTVTGAILNF